MILLSWYQTSQGPFWLAAKIVSSSTRMNSCCSGLLLLEPHGLVGPAVETANTPAFLVTFRSLERAAQSLTALEWRVLSSAT